MPYSLDGNTQSILLFKDFSVKEKTSFLANASEMRIDLSLVMKQLKAIIFGVCCEKSLVSLDLFQISEYMCLPGDVCHH